MAEDERMSEERLLAFEGASNPEIAPDSDDPVHTLLRRYLFESCREIRRSHAAEEIAELGRESALEHLEAHEKVLKAENAALRERVGELESRPKRGQM